MFRGHSTREPASFVCIDEWYDLFILQAYTGTCVSHIQHRKSSEQVLEKNAGEWTERVEISKEEIPGSKRTLHDYM